MSENAMRIRPLTLRESIRRNVVETEDHELTLPTKKPIKSTSVDFNAMRPIKLLLDNHHINDPDSWTIFIPSNKHISKYEPKADRKPQEGKICLCVKHVVDFARKQSGNLKLSFVFLINGEEVKTLKSVLDFIRELVVGPSEFLIGIKYGIEQLERPSTVKRKISYNRRLARDPSFFRKEILKSAMQRRYSVKPAIMHFVRPSPRTEATQRELEQLKKQYPIEVLWKVYRFEQEKQEEIGTDYESIEKKNRDYTCKLETLIHDTQTHYQENIQLIKPVLKPLKVYKQKVQKILFNYQEAIEYYANPGSQNSSVSISGLQSYMEERCPFIGKTPSRIGIKATE